MGDDDMGESVKGAYSYQDDDGKTYSVSYTADENGYRPVRAHTKCSTTFPFQKY